MAQQAYLAYTRPERAVIFGIGEFHKDLPPRPVSDSLAHQYEQPDAVEAGWVVTWEETAPVEEN